MINLKTSALALIVSCAASTLATADDEHKWELTGGIGRYFFDSSDTNVEDANALNIGIGYVIDKDWTVEGIYSDFETEANYSNTDIDGSHYHLDALYHLSKQGKWQPFLIGGIGDLKLEPESTNSYRQTLLNAGAGVKYALSPQWQIRGDARTLYSLDEESTDYNINLGLTYLFGKSQPKAPLDSDNDGINDSLDDCPNTPQGEMVNSKGCPTDSDNDGIKDANDNCPNTPANTNVNTQGCPLDSDGDGVYDSKDQCPKTEKNLKVDVKGCPITLKKTVNIDLAVNFDNNSSVVKQAYLTEIKRVAEFMTQYANTTVIIEGHTDDSGPEKYNKNLSQRRADAVASTLISKMGISADRVKSIGYGETKPIASNGTTEGRQQNRRVIAKISSEATSLKQR